MRLGNHPNCSFALRENDFQLTINVILIYLFIFKCISHKEQKQNLKPHRNVTMEYMPMYYVENIGMDFIYFFLFHALLFVLHTKLAEQQKVKKLIMYWGKEKILS